ncbi:hypothetical protein [Streptomyces sp. NPDC102360]|uniref:hypothetical protein n=1 Tax=Streptomyces sp. NPDC102360 TaxID=3366160 RepID=UPI00380282BE
MTQLDTLARMLRAHFADLRHQIKERGDAGYTTETIIVTALLAILGLTVVGVIVAKVTAKANGIDLGR